MISVIIAISSSAQYSSNMLESIEMDTMISSELQRLSSSELTRECSKCGAMYPARKRKCDVCSGWVVACKESDMRYDSFKNPLPKFLDVGQKGFRNPAKISTMEPRMRNPNSFESIVYILDAIKAETIDNDTNDEDDDDNDSSLKWIFVGADGPPYAEDQGRKSGKV